MSDAVLLGQVMHERGTPPAHAFRYPMSMIRLNLDSADSVMKAYRWWGVSGRHLGRLKAQDYLDGSAQTPAALASAIRRRVENQTNTKLSGTVELTTQPRCWGIAFNPINLYRCHGASGDLAAVVVEVNNTPWGENITYVLATDGQDEDALDLRFSKEMHVSPFQPMNLQYRLRWFRRGGNDHIALDCLEQSGSSTIRRVFAARMALNAESISQTSLNRLLRRNALMPARVAVGIYWQAFRLWLKRATYFPYPGPARGTHDSQRAESSS